jgi:hypothetical protein
MRMELVTSAGSGDFVGGSGCGWGYEAGRNADGVVEGYRDGGATQSGLQTQHAVMDKAIEVIESVESRCRAQAVGPARCRRKIGGVALRSLAADGRGAPRLAAGVDRGWH